MTSAELAILSLVAERPRHGYEIEQVIEERGMREWAEIGFSSIYYLLKKLETQGLVEGEMQASARGAGRKVYQITPAGREALRVGLLEALSVPQPSHPPLLLGLGNLPGLDPEEALAALRQYQQALAGRLEHIRERWISQRPLPLFVRAMFHYSLTMVRTEMNWIDRLIREMGSKNEQD